MDFSEVTLTQGPCSSALPGATLPPSRPRLACIEWTGMGDSEGHHCSHPAQEHCTRGARLAGGSSETWGDLGHTLSPLGTKGKVAWASQRPSCPPQPRCQLDHKRRGRVGRSARWADGPSPAGTGRQERGLIFPWAHACLHEAHQRSPVTHLLLGLVPRTSWGPFPLSL